MWSLNLTPGCSVDEADESVTDHCVLGLAGHNVDGFDVTCTDKWEICLTVLGLSVGEHPLKT